MEYFLTEEQIKEIQKNYCGDKEVILFVQDKVNQLKIVNDPDKFHRIVIEVCSAFQSLMLQFIYSNEGRKFQQRRPNDNIELYSKYYVLQHNNVEEMIFNSLGFVDEDAFDNAKSYEAIDEDELSDNYFQDGEFSNYLIDDAFEEFEEKPKTYIKK